MDAGFSITNHLFTRLEVESVCDAFADTRTQPRRGGIRGAFSIPAVRELADDARLVNLAREFIGATARPLRATVFDKSAASNWLVTWHQDTVLPVKRRVPSADWGPWTRKAGQLHAGAPASALEQIVALRIHLDDSTPANGPLRVLPDTHLMGVLSCERIEQIARDVEAIDCTAEIGGVIAMRPLLVHSSSKSRDAAARRRVLHIEYIAATSFGDLELAV